MFRTHTLIVGAGQAGLAMSRCLAERAIDHVVIERGRIAERWRSERWDSLRLLTPNWQSRLPGYHYDGPDPDGYMAMTDVVAYLERYAATFEPPVEDHTSVLSVKRADAGYEITTDRGRWNATNVVVASGYCDRPRIPVWAEQLPADILQLAPSQYRNPSQLPDGAVLVVGASSTGIQLADEIAASGRAVIVAVGRHLRVPRCYRGRDILWWLDRMGTLTETVDDVFDVRASRSQPSWQLVGRPDHRSIDLPTLETRGVRLTGRLVGCEGSRLFFDDDLVSTTVASDVKLAGLIQRMDAFATCASLTDDVAEPEPFVPCWPLVPRTPETLDMRREGISTVIWATGYRREYPWLQVPVLDRRGEIRHDAGVTPVPGLYVLGLQFQRRRNSAFIDGVGADARDLAAHIAGDSRGARPSATGLVH